MESRGRVEYGADGTADQCCTASASTSPTREQRGRGAAGSRSPQGRIPRHARARAAQSAGANQLGPAHPARGAGARAGDHRARDHGSPGRPDGAPGRRPARCRAHHHRQGRSAHASRSIWPTRFATPSRPPRRSSRNARIASRCSAPPEPVFVNADRTRLAQVFANLLNNSARYSEPGQPISVTFVARGRATRWSGCAMPAWGSIRRCCRGSSRCSARPIAPAAARAAGSASACRWSSASSKCTAARSRRTATGLGQGSEFVVRIPAIDAAVASRPVRRQAAANAGDCAAQDPGGRRQRRRRRVARGAAVDQRSRYAHGA